jgi:hypothetical protein
VDPYCPIFKVNYILSKAEPDPYEKYMMLSKVIFLLSNYSNCNG